jgi:uncharacterized protein (TIGR03083 family)
MNEPGRITDAEVEELLGAYALDACEPGEVELVEATLARRPDLAREAEMLTRVAAWLGAAQGMEAPVSLRADVLARARAGGRAAVDPAVDLYVSESDRFADAVAALAPGALDATTANGLTARELVVHVAAQESLLAQLVGTPVTDAFDATDIELRTEQAIAALRTRPLDDALRVWRDAVDANRRWAIEERTDGAEWRGVVLSRHDAIVVRAFETWVHGNDLRRVGGLGDRAPEPRHLALMTDLAGRSLGLSLAMADRLRPGRTARLVLTGPGGGEWLVGMGGDAPGARVDVTVTTDAVAWCRLVGDRLRPADARCAVAGDRHLAADLMAAAPALATL